MTKKVIAIVYNFKKGLLLGHQKGTDESNANWCMPFWEVNGGESAEDCLKRGLASDIGDYKYKVLGETEVDGHVLFPVYVKRLKIDEIKSERYDQFEYRPLEIVRDLSSEENYDIYRVAFIRLGKFLEPAFKRWFRIFVKLIAAIVLFLLPFAILWNILKNQ